MLDETTPSSIAKPYRDAIAGCDVIKGEGAFVIHFKHVFHDPLEHLQFSVLPEARVPVDRDPPGRRLLGASDRVGTDEGREGAHRGASSRRSPTRSTPPASRSSPSTRAAIPRFRSARCSPGASTAIISVPPSFRPDIAASDEVALKSYDLRSWWYVAINTAKGPLKDKRVRQALDRTIDRTELRELTIGVAADDPSPPCEFISGPFVGTSPYYNRTIHAVETSDRVTAASLMTAAGAKLTAGRWTWTDGTPIALKVGMDAPLDGEAKDLLSQIGNQLQAGGFDRTVYKISSDDWSRKAVAGQMTDFDLLIGKWSFGQVEDINPLFHTRSPGGQGALNVFNYANPAVDALLGQFDGARTDTEARDVYHELHKTLADDLPYLFLWSLGTKSAWRNAVRNNIITPYYYFTEFDGWRFSGA